MESWNANTQLLLINFPNSIIPILGTSSAKVMQCTRIGSSWISDTTPQGPSSYRVFEDF